MAAKKPRFSEEDFQTLINNLNRVQSPKTAPSEPEHPSMVQPALKPAAKRSKTSQDIIKTIQNSVVFHESSGSHVALAFSGARLLSLNEIFALLQFKKEIIFKYKKTWHHKVQSALTNLSEKPYFDSPCKITLYRQSTRLLDRDSLTVCFKFIIDALKRDPIHNPHGILSEDNPEIVFEDLKFQNKGEHQIGIRIERLINPTPVTFTLASLFDSPSADLQKISIETLKEPLNKTKLKATKKEQKSFNSNQP